MDPPGLAKGLSSGVTMSSYRHRYMVMMISSPAVFEQLSRAPTAKQPQTNRQIK